MMVMVLVMMVDWCAHLFLCLGPLLGPLGGPGGSENLPKQRILLWLPSMPRNGLNKAQTWLNITGHIQGDMLKPFRPLESARSTQKWPILSPKKTVFWRFWGLPGDIFWGHKGPNWPPWMCLTMFNHVWPMFNPFGLAGTAYGQIWPFRAKKEPFLAIKMA